MGGKGGRLVGLLSCLTTSLLADDNDVDFVPDGWFSMSAGVPCPVCHNHKFQFPCTGGRRGNFEFLGDIGVKEVLFLGKAF